MRTTKEPITKETAKPTRTSGSLEAYLKTCVKHCDVYEFSSTEEAYDYGQQLVESVLKEEGVHFREQLKKFNVDISYKTVRIKLLDEESALR